MTFERLSQQAHRRPLQLGILLFPEVEVLDFAGPFEVFSVASRMARRDQGIEHAAFEIQTIAASRAPLRARHGLDVVPTADFDSHAPLDLLVVPGGVIEQPLGDAPTLDWLSVQAQRLELLASVCTGAFLLAEIGLLDGLRATTHWEDIPALRQAYPRVEVCEGVPYVEQGRLFTSAGISAGITLSLHLVERLLGRPLALATARQMQYDWQA